MQLLRRFLVIQALMLWQGGFLFYAGVVVPTGTEVLGSFTQGRVTRHVTDAMNLIGLFTLVFLAWDHWQSNGLQSGQRSRWIIWSILVVSLAALFVIHPRIESLVDFAPDGHIANYPAFYLWHRVYLYIATAQWVAGLVYVAVTLRSWGKP